MHPVPRVSARSSATVLCSEPLFLPHTRSAQLASALLTTMQYCNRLLLLKWVAENCPLCPVNKVPMPRLRPVLVPIILPTLSRQALRPPRQSTTPPVRRRRRTSDATDPSFQMERCREGCSAARRTLRHLLRRVRSPDQALLRCNTYIHGQRRHCRRPLPPCKFIPSTQQYCPEPRTNCQRSHDK